MLDIKSIKNGINEIIQLNEGLTRKEMLMEMPATNYTTFDIEPYILCDADYPTDEDGQIIEDLEPFVPFLDYVDRHSRIPEWLESSYSRTEFLPMPKLNNDLDEEIVCIVGIPGYYDGISVGIEMKDKDEYIDGYYTCVEADNGTPIAYTKDEEQRYDQESPRYTRAQVEAQVNALYEKELSKARNILIEAHYSEGGRIVPRGYELSEPESSGDELNESANQDKTLDALVKLFKNDSDFKKEFKDNGGGNDAQFEKALRQCCYEYVTDDTYQWDREPDYGNSWAKANGVYFNLDNIWDDWSNFCGELDEEFMEFTEPVDTGDELNENKQLNEWVIDFGGRIPVNGSKTIYVGGWYITLSKIQSEFNPEDFYYDLYIHDKESIEFSDNVETFTYNTMEECYDSIIEYLKKYGKKDKDVEPENDGSELNENVSRDEYEEWDKDDTEIIGVGETKNYIYKGYKIYVSASYDEYDENGDDLIVFYASVSLPDGTERVFSDEGWLDLCYSVTNFIDRFADDNYTEPETDGDELNESEENSSWERYAPPVGSGVKFKVGLSTFEALCSRNDGFRSYYKLRIFDDNEKDYTEITFDDWNDLVRCTKIYARYPEADPEESGEEYMESLNESWLPGVEWLDEPIAYGENKTFYADGYDFNIESNSDSDGEYYYLIIYRHDIEDDDRARVQEAAFGSWDNMAIAIKDFLREKRKENGYDKEVEPENDGSELNERFDMKTIRKQINEIVEKANG